MKISHYCISIIIIIGLSRCTTKNGTNENSDLANKSKMEKKIIKRTAAKQSGLFYNKGGYSVEPFRRNKIYPEISDSIFHNYLVPVLYRIKEDSSLYDIAIEKDHVRNNLYPNHQLTTSREFEEEALRLMHQSGKWNPFTLDDKYVDREGRLYITFEYHPEYFKTSKNSIALNPDVKAKFIGDKELYNRYVHPKNGSDGQATFLAIIEKDGTISNEYCLGSVGKTNCEICLSCLKKLSSWKPAIKKGKVVRSQIMITISPY